MRVEWQTVIGSPIAEEKYFDRIYLVPGVGRVKVTPQDYSEAATLGGNVTAVLKRDASVATGDTPGFVIREFIS